MSIGEQQRSPVDTPRFAAVDGPAINRTLGEFLLRPELRKLTLISFGFGGGLRLPAQPQLGGARVFLIERLLALLDRVRVTIVTSPPSDDSARFGAHAQLRRLAAAGAEVLLRDDLHAKVYLFEEPRRRCWVVGSSNLTGSGLGNPDEVNLKGFHPSDYELVETFADSIKDGARPLAGPRTKWSFG